VIDPELLRTFVVVARSGGFSAAARELGKRQSTISGQVQRLEAQVGRRLLDRDSHRVELTSDGQALVGFAHDILDKIEVAENYFGSDELTGHVRFGVSEDIMTDTFPALLRRFWQAHPRVDLDLRVGLSETLHQQTRINQVDLAFIKRRPGERHGTFVFDDELVWAGRGTEPLPAGAPIPVVAYPPPSITRQAGLAALERAGLGHRITCVTDDLAGLRAAAAAGLGYIVHSHSLLPASLEVMPHLPDLGRAEYVLVSRAGPRSRAVQALFDLIIEDAHGPAPLTTSEASE
jgi:DNA-binding transcriptional LysR family regulator